MVKNSDNILQIKKRHRGRSVVFSIKSMKSSLNENNIIEILFSEAPSKRK